MRIEMNLEQNLNEITGKLYGKNISACTDAQLYTGVLQLTKEKMAETPVITGDKKVYYISMEFLIGKLLSNNLINLGIYEELNEILKKNGKNLADIEEAEPEPSLGNGGLGRLAACFLDSIATLGYPGDGIGLNYHFGLFKQVFKDHLQNAEKNDWIQKDSWLNNTGTKFEVAFGKRKVTSVLYDIDFTENAEDTSIRDRLEKEAEEKGAEYLHQKLQEVDPASAEAIHANNIKRVIRALEFYEQTGEKISLHNETERQKESAYASCYFVLNDDREKLYERIDRRVDEMLAEGLVAEVEALKKRGCTRKLVSMQGLGYKEILAYLDGEYSLEEAVYRIKRDTRHFAKRQITWLKREKEVIWINKPDFSYEIGRAHV